jgi:hypothetical protein
MTMCTVASTGSRRPWRILAAVLLQALAVAGPSRGQPAMTLSPPTVRFPTVTTGSTVAESLLVTNSGNEDLTISDLKSPSPVAVTGATWPRTLGPGASLGLVLTFHPLEPEPLAGSLRIHSNDVLRPTIEVPLLADVRSLAVRTQALVRSPAPLGEAATIQAVPVDSLASIEHIALHYRARGAGPFASGDMAPFGPSWAGFVPGAQVRESGVEYYVEVRNGDAVLLDPPAGPSGPFSFDVAAPRQLSVVAQRTSRAGFAPDVEIPVDVELPLGTDFDHGKLYYRQIGKARYDSTALAPAARPEALRAVIPASAATFRGLEYKLTVATRDTVLPYPPAGAPAPSDTIRITVGNLREPATHPGGRYRLLSVPLGYGATSGITIETMLSDQPEFGPYDPFRWRAFRYVGGRNVEFARGDTLFLPDPGRAFWLVSRTDHAVDTAPVEGLSTSRPRDARGRRVRLDPGWNQFGNPFGFPVLWNRVTISDTTAVGSLTAYDPNAGTRGDWAPDPPAVLQPFDGYFILNASTRQQTIWVPPVEAGQAPASSARVGSSRSSAQRAGPATMDSWRLRLAARTEDAEDGANVLGVDREARDLEDGQDSAEPPTPPGGWVRVGFAAAEPGGPLLRRDFRAAGSGGHAWEVEVTVPERGMPVTLDLSSESALPAELAVRLLDRETKAVVEVFVPRDPAAAGSLLARYPLLGLGPDRPYRITILAGARDWVDRETEGSTSVPVAIALDQNSPNPFNAATRIRFGLPAAERVTLEIYDVRGRVVASLLHEESYPAGYHSVLWNGTDRTAGGVASGIYLCRLRAGGATLTRRLVLLE